VDVSEEAPEIVAADPDRFCQVLNNLVGNAVKFTQEGEISVRVEPKKEASGQEFLEVSVSDTGIGIPEDKRAGLFENFVQADSSHSRRFGGAGLGLAISKGLVERMGGTIDLQSTEGKGSTFRFRLPMAAQGLKPKRKKEDQNPPESDSPEKPVRILLAEDDPMISEVLTIILRQAGWEVFTVENGRECVERFEAGRFDVILMDIQMPQMNGYEAARTIREKENGGNPIPIIALTAHALDEAREKSRKSGMNGYLTKPVDRDQLIAMVRSMLKAA
jgi:CheY-like chemotaxis protein